MAEQARVKIACPDCGAPLPPEAAKVAVKCPQCGHTSAPLPQTEAIVQTIVVERVVTAPAAASASTLPCPRCNASLFEGNAHGVRLLGCGICGGIFLDNEGSTRITRAPDLEIAKLAERARDRAVVTTINTRPTVRCPSCTATMERVLARGVVEIDFCRGHGTWFDRGELQPVMGAFASRPDDPDAKARAEAEARMAHFRDRQAEAIGEAEREAIVGGVFAGLSVAALGVLGALAGSTKS